MQFIQEYNKIEIDEVSKYIAEDIMGIHYSKYKKRIIFGCISLLILSIVMIILFMYGLNNILVVSILAVCILASGVLFEFVLLEYRYKNSVRRILFRNNKRNIVLSQSCISVNGKEYDLDKIERADIKDKYIFIIIDKNILFIKRDNKVDNIFFDIIMHRI